MSHYERIALVIEYLETHFQEQPDLDTLAKVAGLSVSRFHRLFSEWAGVTPKDFLKKLTHDFARSLLREGQSVLDVSLESGLSGPGRLHDLCLSLEAASPGEIKSGGEGWVLRAGFAESPFGQLVIVEGPRGICRLSFEESVDRVGIADTLKEEWPLADLEWSDARAKRQVDRIFVSSNEARDEAPLKAYVKGSAFQLKVWRALLEIPEGRLTTYGNLAERIGKPKASRAVGTAVGKNPIAYLIPCHKVVRKNGALGGYRWGATRKRALIARGV